MSWTPEKVEKLKELWGKGNTASEIAQILGGVTRNAVIGKAHRLNLSGKIQTKKSSSLATSNNVSENKISPKNLRRGKFKSLIIDKDFEPENPKQLEELDENSCKWPIGHPNEDNFYFCGRTSLKDFSYCKLHLLYAYQPKGKKEDIDLDEGKMGQLLMDIQQGATAKELAKDYKIPLSVAKDFLKDYYMSKRNNRKAYESVMDSYRNMIVEKKEMNPKVIEKIAKLFL